MSTSSSQSPYVPAHPDESVKARVEALFHGEVPESAALPELNCNRYLLNGELVEWSGKSQVVESPLCLVDAATGQLVRRRLGTIHCLEKDAAMELLENAYQAFDNGRGAWPRATPEYRIECVTKFIAEMAKLRETIVRLLMHEIGKARKESEAEFDRTIKYIQETAAAVRARNNNDSRILTASGHAAQVRRSPLGVALVLGPANYPLNETLVILLPALIMGNCCVAKLPRAGALALATLFPALQSSFPPGAVNAFFGRGVETVGPIIQSGKLSAMAFIGGSSAANMLRVQHPKPSRMRCVLGLDAKNAAIVMPDADLDTTIKELLLGTLGFSGQRCTAIKITFVHRSIVDRVLERLAAAVDAIGFGLPWSADDVAVSPLYEYSRVQSMQAYVDDAIAHGASVVNRNGGLTNGSFYYPSVVYPVKPTMRLWTEEQFGPVVPIVPFDDVSGVIDYVADSKYGQQVSVFGFDPVAVGSLIDILVNIVCRVNLNGACKRGPDEFPFTARKDSAEGTLDIESAIRAFSIRTMVAAPITTPNRMLIQHIITQRTSQFLNNVRHSQ